MSEQVDFDTATAVRASGEGRFDAEVMSGWDIRGVPHGGYLLALAARAMAEVVAQPHPISISASYLSPPQFGPAHLDVTVLRAGRRQSTVTARMTQDDSIRIDATATFGTLGYDPPEPWASELADPPPLPGPDRCLSTSSASGAEPIGLHRNVELRLDPALGWLRDEPNGSAEVNGWMRFPDRASDAWGLLLFSDGMPPSVFERLGRIVGHTPTMQLTTHLFSLPDTAWVRGRFRTRLRAGSLLDEDGELWDANGKIVATARQLALLRS